MKQMAKSDYIRFVRNISPTDENGCWPWNGTINGKGYGYIFIKGKQYFAHRLSYGWFTGPLKDMWAHHKCENSLCVNPTHLEAKTPRQHKRDHWAAMTHCRRGHEFTKENTYWYKDVKRLCRICHRRRHKESYDRAKLKEKNNA